MTISFTIPLTLFFVAQSLYAQIVNHAPEGAVGYRLEIPAAPSDRPGPRGGRRIQVPRPTERDPDQPIFWTLRPFQLPVDVPEGKHRIRYFDVAGNELPPPPDLSELPAVVIRFAGDDEPPPPPPPPPEPEEDRLERLLARQEMEESEAKSLEKVGGIQVLVRLRDLVSSSAERESESKEHNSANSTNTGGREERERERERERED